MSVTESAGAAAFESDLPLAGIRVVELASIIAGPSAGMTLADLGATVIKLEAPDGDPARSIGPSVFPTFNRNVSGSVVVDLHTPEGVAEAASQMAAADVVIAGMRPGLLAPFGLDAESVRRDNESCVYVTLTGFGSRGPDSARGGLDNIVQAESGMMSLNGELGGAPMRMGLPVVDVAAGMAIVQAVLVGLIRRDRSGIGTSVDVSLLDCALYMQAFTLSEFSVTGVLPVRSGSSAPHGAPSDVIETKDGSVLIAAYLPSQWRKLCDAIGAEELHADPRFDSMQTRRRHRGALIDELAARLASRTTAEVVAALRAHGVIHGEVRDYHQVLASEQVATSGALLDLDVGDGRTMKAVAVPYVMDGWRSRVRTLPPALGETAKAPDPVAPAPAPAGT